MGRILTLLVGLVFVLGGSVAHLATGLGPARQQDAARRWHQTTCTIERSEVIESTDSDGDTTFRIAFAYRYSHAGRSYRGHRYDFGVPSRSGADARAAVRAAPKGSVVACWLDPDAPGDVVLVRAGFRLFWGLFGLGFQMVGLFILGTGLGVHQPRTRIRDGVLEVRPRWGRSSIVVVGAAGIAAQLAVTVVALIGLGLVAAALIYGTALLTAIVIGGHKLGQRLTGLRFEVTPTALAPGRGAELRWILRAPFGVGRGQIRLIGRERVWRGAGSDRTMSTHVFCERRLAELTEPHRRVALPLAIPDGVPTTFEGANARIEWVLAIHVELPRWPDLDLEVPIAVELAPPALSRRPLVPPGAPAPQGPPRLELASTPPRYAGGEPIVGRVAWGRRAAPDRVAVGLMRMVDVIDGGSEPDEEIVTIDVASLPPAGAASAGEPFRGSVTTAAAVAGLQASDVRALQLDPPVGATSYDGRELRVRWGLRLVVDDVEIDRQPIELI